MKISFEVEEKLKYTQERLIGELYAEFLGPEFSSIHTGRDNDSADCLIVQNRKEFSTVEISRHMDPEQATAMSHIERVYPELKFGSENFGKWALTIPNGDKSKDFTKSIVVEICSTLDLAIRSCDCKKHSWDCSTKKDILTDRGLIDARKVPDGPGEIWLFLASEALLVKQDPDIFRVYLEDYLAQERVIKKTFKPGTPCHGYS